MPATMTLLRYPGGKTKLFDYLTVILQRNNLLNCTYVEPFAGGAGLALKLLLRNKVSKLILNDLDMAIYSFWYSILHYPEDFCKLIENTPITLQERDRQKYIFRNKELFSILEVGFSSFFLNRTNISGILHGGPIGGVEQGGKHKLDARFNKANLIEKICKISKLKDSIELHNLDVHDFLDTVISKIDNQNAFIYFDPPYVKKGPSLYLNFFNTQNHIDLANKIFNCNHQWIVTYDKCEFISNLYKDYRQEEITINYSIGNTKLNSEIVIFSNNIY